MAQDITEKETKKSSYYNSRPQSIDTEQLEYSVKQFFVYGTLSVAALTLGVTYLYLLIQKIRN